MAEKVGAKVARIDGEVDHLHAVAIAGGPVSLGQRDSVRPVSKLADAVAIVGVLGIFLVVEVVDAEARVLVGKRFSRQGGHPDGAHCVGRSNRIVCCRGEDRDQELEELKGAQAVGLEVSLVALGSTIQGARGLEAGVVEEDMKALLGGEESLSRALESRQFVVIKRNKDEGSGRLGRGCLDGLNHFVRLRLGGCHHVDPAILRVEER